MTITIVIGDSTLAVNKDDAALAIKGIASSDKPVSAQPNQSGIILQVANNNAPVTVSVFDLSGKAVYRTTQHFEAGSNFLPVDLAGGHYMVTVKQGSQKSTVQWFKK